MLVAIGVCEEGHRHVLAVETGWGESELVWTAFIGGLNQRGRSGVAMFTSDAHPGIKAALRSPYSGIPWQRCQFHFLRNALDKIPKKREEHLEEALQQIWRKQPPPGRPKPLEELSMSGRGRFQRPLIGLASRSRRP